MCSSKLHDCILPIRPTQSLRMPMTQSISSMKSSSLKLMMPYRKNKPCQKPKNIEIMLNAAAALHVFNHITTHLLSLRKPTLPQTRLKSPQLSAPLTTLVGQNHRAPHLWQFVDDTNVSKSIPKGGASNA